MSLGNLYSLILIKTHEMSLRLSFKTSLRLRKINTILLLYCLRKALQKLTNPSFYCLAPIFLRGAESCNVSSLMIMISNFWNYAP